MWPCIATCDRASWHVTVHCDMWPCIVTCDRALRHTRISFITKPTRCTNFTNLFWHETLHVSGSSFVHQQDQDGTAVPSRSCSTAVYKPVWHKPLLSVQWINCWWWTDELSETCRVHAKNKFVKLVHLVGFVVKATCVLFTGQPVTVWGQVQSQTKPF